MIATNTCKAILSTAPSAGPQNYHWSSESQSYASGDILINYLRNGWTPAHSVMMQTFHFGGYRHVHVFRFRLTQGDQTLTIPVIANPIIDRLIRDCQMDCIPMSQVIA